MNLMHFKINAWCPVSLIKICIKTDIAILDVTEYTWPCADGMQTAAELTFHATRSHSAANRVNPSSTKCVIID